LTAGEQCAHEHIPDVTCGTSDKNHADQPSKV